MNTELEASDATLPIEETEGLDAWTLEETDYAELDGGWTPSQRGQD